MKIFSQKNIGAFLVVLSALQLTVYVWRLVQTQMLAIPLLRILAGIVLLLIFLYFIVWNLVQAKDKAKPYVSIINTLAVLLFVVLILAATFSSEKLPFLTLFGNLLFYSFPLVVGIYLYLQVTQDSFNKD